jgi:succinate-acetate transporter protein
VRPHLASMLLRVRAFPQKVPAAAADNRLIGFFYVFITIISVVYLVCALRVNITLVIGLVLLILDFSLIAGINFQAALGNLDIAARLQTVSTLRSRTSYKHAS